MSDLAREGLDAIKGVLAGLAGDDPLITTCYAVSGQNVRDLRAAVAPIEAALGEQMVCNECGKPAACLGHYDDAPWAYGCNDCCGHGCEDGWCVALNVLPEYLAHLCQEFDEQVEVALGERNAARQRIRSISAINEEAGKEIASAALRESDLRVRLEMSEKDRQSLDEQWKLGIEQYAELKKEAAALRARAEQAEKVNQDWIRDWEAIAEAAGEQPDIMVTSLRGRIVNMCARAEEAEAEILRLKRHDEDAFDMIRALHTERDAALAQVERLLDVAGSTTRMGKERSVDDAVRRVMALRKRSVENGSQVERLRDALGKTTTVLESGVDPRDGDRAVILGVGADGFKMEMLAGDVRGLRVLLEGEPASACEDFRAAMDDAQKISAWSKEHAPAEEPECPYCKQGRPFVDQDAHGHSFPKMAHVGGVACTDFREPAPVDETIYHHGKPISGTGCTRNPNSTSSPESGEETT